MDLQINDVNRDPSLLDQALRFAKAYLVLINEVVHYNSCSQVIAIR